MAMIAKEARRINKTGKKKWRDDMYKNRWKYLFGVSIYILLTIFFLLVGWHMRESFYGAIRWYIWMGLSTIFLILGIFTWFSYLWIIIKGK